MPELLGLLLLSLIANALFSYLWWEAVQLAKQRLALLNSYAQGIRARNQIIIRLCHQAHTKALDERLIAEAEEMCNGESNAGEPTDRTRT